MYNLSQKKFFPIFYKQTPKPANTNFLSPSQIPLPVNSERLQEREDVFVKEDPLQR